jgi:hypothetical protein
MGVIVELTDTGRERHKTAWHGTGGVASKGRGWWERGDSALVSRMGDGGE